MIISSSVNTLCSKLTVTPYRTNRSIADGVNRNNTLHTAAKTNSISQSFPIIPVLLASFPMLGTNTMINSGAAAKIVDDISDDNPLSSKNVAAIGPNTPCAAYVSKTVKAYIK